MFCLVLQQLLYDRTHLLHFHPRHQIPYCKWLLLLGLYSSIMEQVNCYWVYGIAEKRINTYREDCSSHAYLGSGILLRMSVCVFCVNCSNIARRSCYCSYGALTVLLLSIFPIEFTNPPCRLDLVICTLVIRMVPCSSLKLTGTHTIHQPLCLQHQPHPCIYVT